MLIEFRTEEDPEIIPEEWLSERMRNLRNASLVESDWTQTADAPVDQSAWANYRQQLRDFPSTWTPSETAEFPDPPA